MYRICSNCVMDTSDPQIVFDEIGVCDHCRNFERKIRTEWQNTDDFDYLRLVAKSIKKNSSSEFDCIIGLSGGLDSSYTAYVAKEIMGLNPLLYHVDAGWNTDQAVGNIESLVNGLGLELFTDVINWKEMRDLQLAYFKSGVPDLDTPQDTAFFSSLYKFARKNKIKYILTGGNYSTECCREPNAWGAYPGIDKMLIKDIYRKFGNNRLKTFPVVDIFTYKIIYQLFLGMKVFKPLNHVNFVKKDAENLLMEKFGWMPFKHKHHESRFTRFYEDYWMPKKFGFEKRRAHLSSLILTGQLKREEALSRLESSELGEDFIRNEIDFVADKLSIQRDELLSFFEIENKSSLDYRNKYWLIMLGGKILSYLGLEGRQYR